MRYKGLIFDFNGVLLWDSHLHEKAWKEFSANLRSVPLTTDEIFAHVHGRTNRAILEYLLDRPVSEDELKKLSTQKETIYQEMCLENREDFKLSPGSIELLEFLSRKNISRTIASASDKFNIDFFVKHLELGQWFDVSQIVYDDGSYPGKYEMYQQAVKNLGLAPEHCVVVEDSKSGINAAHKANIGKIIALSPADMHDMLLKIPGVSHAITSFCQFEKEILFSSI